MVQQLRRNRNTERRQTPQDRGPTGGGGCRDHFRIVFFGNPSGGSISLPITIDGTPDSVTIAFDDDAADLSTALQTHSEVSSSSQVVTGSPGGSLPHQELWFYFTEGIDMSTVTVGNAVDSLTGGSSPYSIIRRAGNEL